jgi:glucose/arabinose dehydrogenase
MPDSVDRRGYLVALGVALAGCGSPADGDGAVPEGTTTQAGETDPATGAPTSTETDTQPPTRTGTATRTETDAPTRTETDTPTPVPFETPPDLPAAAQQESPIEDGPTVSLETVATGFRQPLAVEDIPGTDGAGTDGHVRFIADKLGTIHVQDDTGVRSEPVLDISDDLVERESWETGLIGLALHPDFGSNRRYFVRYSAERRAGTPAEYNHTAVLVEYQATKDLTGTVDRSAQTVMEIPEPGRWHNAGDIVFGPEGYLYVALGDGGDGSDQGMGHVDDWYDAVEGGNGQDITENLLGSILRIDVDGQAGGKNYAVPENNPLVGQEGFDEQYAWGFRNPYRMSFHDDGTLFVGDVGQDSYEEVSIVTRGGNYGWNVKEGVACFRAGNCPGTSLRGDRLIDPVMAYSHDVGAAVIGGQFYTGDCVPSLRNRYVFGDIDGAVFAARPPESRERLWQIETVDAGLDGAPLGFGQAPDGELYLLATDFNGSGTVHRIVRS